MAKKPRPKRVETADGKTIVVQKNPNGTGSAYPVTRKRKNKATGKTITTTVWKATYIDPTTGKRRTVSAPTKTAAVAARDEKVATLARLTAPGRLGETPTVAELAAWWLENEAPFGTKKDPGPETLQSYANDVDRITIGLGRAEVADLDKVIVQTFLADLAKPRRGPDGTERPGYAAGTIRNTRARLSQIAKCAVTHGYLTTNPVTNVAAPDVADPMELPMFDVDDVRRLLDVLDGTRPYDAAIGLLFLLGIRVSEALGLAWSDLDLDSDAPTAKLTRGCTYAGKGLGKTLHPLKTKDTAGVHHLPPTAVALLKARRTEQKRDRLAAGEAWTTHTYRGKPLAMVFTTLTGDLVARQYVAKALATACERAGIDPITATHSGRRSVVTALYGTGMPIEDVSRFVGHADPAMTRRYVASLGERPAKVAQVAATLFDPAANRDT